MGRTKVKAFSVNSSYTPWQCSNHMLGNCHIAGSQEKKVKGTSIYET